jgi:hypothetical protein
MSEEVDVDVKAEPLANEFWNLRAKLVWPLLPSAPGDELL